MPSLVKPQEGVREASPAELLVLLHGRDGSALPSRFAPAADFSIEDYLAVEHGKDLLRFSTAGSVDDGKSTLIGRLLLDTQSVYEDQVRSIEGKGTTAVGVLDLALLTDGLRAEREQGITIDVAYRYFSTSRRKFIIADTPGHEQYTRNMATGASTSDVAIVLVDARKGVLKQSRRHAYITALLGVQHIILAVNKMDLVDWSEPVFRGICADFEHFFASLGSDIGRAATLHSIPVSALAGDNIVHPSGAMPWYAGPTLLALLESIPAAHSDLAAPFRFALQRIARPHLDFRGFAGQIAGGAVRPGDPVLALPSGQRSRVARIVTFDGDLALATAPLSVTLTLEDEIDLSRGDLLVSPEAPAQIASHFTASLVWMDNMPLDLGRRYLLKQTSRTVQARVHTLLHTVDLTEVELTESADKPLSEIPNTLAINGIGLVTIETLSPLCLDTYTGNRHTGSFILIDGQTNATIAAGMIRSVIGISDGEPLSSIVSDIRSESLAVSPEERAARWGHKGAHLVVAGDPALADALERALFARGTFILRVDAPAGNALAAAGALALSCESSSPQDSPKLTVHRDIHSDMLTRTIPLPPAPLDAVADTLRLLDELGILRKGVTA